MAWICDNCSTANEDSQKVCFVCDTPRSEASILAEKERERAEKERLIRAKVDYYRSMIRRFGSVAYKLGELIGFIVIIIVGIMKLRSGQATDLFLNTATIVRLFADKILLAGKNIGLVLGILLAAIFTKMQFHFVGEALEHKAKELSYNVIIMYERIYEAIMKIRAGIQK